MKNRIALFGGSFNPVHNGHLIVARCVAETLAIDRVVFLPSRTPPHKTGEGMAPADDRAEMVRLAIEGEGLFDFSDHDLACEGPSYTVKAVAHFRKASPEGTEVLWIIGADSLLELHTWYKVPELTALCRLVTAVRPGHEVGNVPELHGLLDERTIQELLANVVETPRIDISATGIRQRVAEGKSIRYLVPESVERYIVQQNLYMS